MYKRFVFIFYVICFVVSCDALKNNKNNDQNRLLQDVESMNLKLDWKSNLGLSNEELDTITFFVNALKSELPKAHTGAAHFNIYLKGDISQIEDYVKRFLFKLKDKGKVKELISYIKYGRDNQPNVEGRDEQLGIDAKEHYRIESRLAGVFDNYFMFLNPPPPPQSLQENSEELSPGPPPPPTINGDAEDMTLNDIKNVCYKFRGSH
ncbi:hypothetical protein [Borreliella afzelii]|uniref:Lipoprotein n=1 Tax=Borreliella afzelii TaxID=29518 RepID=A0AB34Z4J4_BORAF|nr:hypothetical protein [Borreliella afzelii]MBB5141541.1 hypothetical protein [Borreliella afzelii]